MSQIENDIANGQPREAPYAGTEDAPYFPTILTFVHAVQKYEKQFGTSTLWTTALAINMLTPNTHVRIKLPSTAWICVVCTWDISGRGNGDCQERCDG